MVVLQIIQRSSLLRFAQVLIVGLLQVAGVPVAQTATVPSGFEDAAFVRGVSRPTAMAFAPDGRLFVCEQDGGLRVVKNGVLLPTSFYDASVTGANEQGLLGVAFDPSFSNNGYVYIYYTAAANTRNRISRIKASTSNADVAQSNSEVVMLDVASAVGYHNGGAMAFGADGKLYVGVGEAHTSANSQSLSVLEGKLLRLNVAGYPQIVPTDNPFVGVTGARGEIWVLGLRNPFTFGVEPGTGRIYINDVGNSSWEEINLGMAGKNYGWPTCEGTCSNTNFVNPVYAYSHSDGCAITGGTFYRASQFPSDYSGSFFFADYCGNWIHRLRPDNTMTTFASGIDYSPIDLDVGPDGALYYLSRNEDVRRIRYLGGANQNPRATVSATPTNGPAPLSVSFTAQGSSDPDGDPLSFAWAFGDGSTGSGMTATHTYSAAGTFNAQLTVSDGRGGQAVATVSIRAGSGPTGVITSPAAGAQFSAGETLSFSGTASDPVDGTLPARSFNWTILLHHDLHTHPFFGPVGGVRNGSFTVPTVGETSDNIKYVIYLTVTNSSGLTHTSTRDILPRKANITIATQPSGLQVTLDGQPSIAPYTVTGVVGTEREVGTASPQVFNGSTYEFVGWSDGGAITHRISTPATSTTYTATFRRLTPPAAPTGLRVVGP